MDFKTFLPDFEALKKTDWAKPQVDTKDKKNLVMLGGAVLMVVFVFLPWASYGALGITVASKLGIVTWYGVLAFLCAAAAVVGVLYKHTTLTFCAAALGVLFGLLGIILVPSLTVAGVTLSGSDIKAAVDASNGVAYVSHIGAILYLVASVVTGVVAYLKITKK